MNSPIIKVDSLTKRFPEQINPALDDISIEIEAGKLTCLVGQDGAGKTTLIRLIAGLLIPTNGKITVDGLDSIKDTDEIHSITGYMPQRFGLYEDLTVQENLNLYASLKSLEKSKQKDVFEKLLHFTKLEPFLNRLARNLSGGMKQKLGLACSLIQEPKLLLLDEPSVGVDPISRRELFAMVKELNDKNISVVWSTSYLDEADKSEKVILLHEGKILFNGDPNNLIKEVDGKSFLIQCKTKDKRTILTNSLKQKNIIDAIIQGNNVRIVLAENTDLSDLNIEEKILPVKSRFEDAFVNRLGGSPKGDSLLAATIKQIITNNETVIRCKGLTKCFGSFKATDNIDIEIKQGEVFGFLGPNGAGKSTTFKMLCGLLKPTKGEAYVAGIDLRTSSCEARAKIGYMAQKFSLYGNLSVMQNLKFFSGIYGLSGRKQRDAVDEMIDIFKFQSMLHMNSEHLSFGIKQRLALACSLMHRPPILFLDEPTSGVDPITRREFWMHINGLVKKGITIMVSTHYMEEAEYCDRIALIYDGKKIAEGSPDELKEKAKNKNIPNLSLEDAFIELIKSYNHDD